MWRARARSLLWAGLLVGGAAVAALVLVFSWPESGPEEGRFDLGPMDDYPGGSVSTIGEGRFHLVRLSEDTFIALSWRDPYSSCTVPWRPDFVFAGQRGWFRDPCHTNTYDREGRWVSGDHPPQDLHRFPASIMNERVIVDTARYVCGWSPPGAECVEPTPTSQP